MVNNHLGIERLFIPNNSTKGLDNQAEAEPVMEKTINMRNN